MKNKFRSYGFWTALAGAVVVLLNALGQAFGFSVNDEIVTSIIMAIAGVLVVFGVVSMPKGEDENKQDEIEEQKEDQEELEEENKDNKQE